MAYGKRRERAASLYADLGERIHVARRRAGLSQKALGQRLGVTAAAVSDLERAVTRPSLDDIEEIALALQVPIGYLLDCRATPRPHAGEGER